MCLCRSGHRIRFHPLTIIFINLALPMINTIFPSGKISVFTLVFALSILLISGYIRKFIKSVIMVGLFWGIYNIVLIYSASPVLAATLRMMILFLPCIVLASILVSEYNSSELLSGLQSLGLPKIFVIGLTVTIRYMSTFRTEFKIIREAMKVRGVNFSIRHPVRSFEYLLVPQLYRCLILSGELSAAGLTKGIDCPKKRTSFYKRRFLLVDYLAFFVLILSAGLIVGGFI